MRGISVVWTREAGGRRATQVHKTEWEETFCSVFEDDDQGECGLSPSLRMRLRL